MGLKLFNLSNSEAQKDTYQDPRQDEIIQIGIERLENDNGHFMIVARDTEGKIVFRSVAHFLEGLKLRLYDAVDQFYLKTTPGQENHTDPEVIKKDQAFLQKKAREEMEKKS